MSDARSSHARPRQPFLPADDVEDIEAEPVSESGPTEPDLVLPPVTTGKLYRDMITGFAGLHSRFDRLEGVVLGDHAPRITAVERKSIVGRAMPMAGKGVQWGLYITGGLGVALQIASAFYPKAAGPIQQLLQLFQGAQ